MSHAVCECACCLSHRKASAHQTYSYQPYHLPFQDTLVATIAKLAEEISALNDNVALLTPAVQALVAKQSDSTALEANLEPLAQALDGLNTNVVTIVGIINTALGTPAA